LLSLAVLSPLFAACHRANVRQIIFAARFGAHLGNYMMHCHNIVHEDKDMLRAFLVRGSLLPASCHR
jgi:Multicopper oxidase